MTEQDSVDGPAGKALAAAEAIYRLTGLPSFDGALKFLLRRRALGLVGDLASAEHYASPRRRAHALQRAAATAAALEALIRFAAGRGLIAAEHAGRVTRTYQWIRERTARDSSTSPGAEAAAAVPASHPPMNDRQRRIMEYLVSAGQAQISHIRGLFGDTCSEKTLQRDLWQLVHIGLIFRQGDNRWTVYSIGQ